MSVSATQVKELRDRSGVGMMDCKKALVESNGDLDSSYSYLNILDGSYSVIDLCNNNIKRRAHREVQ